MMDKSNLTTGEVTGVLQAPLHPSSHRLSGVGLPAQDDAYPLRVLIADMDQAYRMFLMELLKVQPGFMVDYAHNGLEAIEKIIAFKPHILLVNPNLPIINGMEICRRVKGYPETNPIRIIAITGCHTPATVKNIIDAGADACLQKPVDTSALLDSIRFQAHSSDEIQSVFIYPNDSKKRWQS